MANKRFQSKNMMI